NKPNCPIGLPDSRSMGQNHQKMERKCLIERLYGTKLVGKQAKLSHRLARFVFYGTKPSKVGTEMSHRTAVWDKIS
ncbi:hypothetical protein LIZ76_18030, partial [Caldibacillus sp. 210928-DFI.2.22]|nr:hypothetical protein [Caldibacillus sp. 210928-DFI.2.22]